MNKARSLPGLGCTVSAPPCVIGVSNVGHVRMGTPIGYGIAHGEVYGQELFFNKKLA
jgi:hypothetical protein